MIEMEGKLYDQVICILIDPRSNYNYMSLELVDKCGLIKDLLEESMLNTYSVSQKLIIYFLKTL